MIEFEKTMICHTTFKGEFYRMDDVLTKLYNQAKKRLLHFINDINLRNIDKVRLLCIFIHSYCINNIFR